MIIKWVNDGQKYDDSVELLGFKFETKDTKTVDVYSATGEKTGRTETVVNFVGFTTNKDDDVLLALPKHYQVHDVEEDAREIFNCIGNFIQRSATSYIGELYDDFKSNYPFAAFFEIYNYYVSYGLYKANLVVDSTDSIGKVNWKKTINNSAKFWMNNEIFMFPLYRDKKLFYHNFISDCMVFAIDYTIEKFSTFIALEPTGEEQQEFPFLENKDNVVTILKQYRHQTFKDIDISLIDALIDFYSDLTLGGDYYFKHYAFSSIWEAMVMDYLHAYYKEVDNGVIVIDKANGKKLDFKKQQFHVNAAHPDQYIEPDHYCIDGHDQLIFDAKYYTSVNGVNYKQVAYVYMLKDIIDETTGEKKYPITYAALILPSEKRYSKEHYSSRAEFTTKENMISISEEYFDIREVLRYYNGK